MPTLLLKFAIILQDRRSGIGNIHGPLCHRWLPDGEKDAVVLDPANELKVWFERSGFVQGAFIEFDYKRREVDPEIIPIQGVLDAGPLRGLLKIRGVSEQELMCLRENKIGNAEYIAIGKKVVQELIYPPVARFLDILRVNYGQYWIEKIKKWDSRRESLGSYCVNNLQLKWSVDESGTWTPFVPDDPIIQLTATFNTTSSNKYLEYLVKEDWEEINKIFREGYQPTLAAFILTQARELLENEELKYSIIEAVTALEVALDEFIDEKLQGGDSIREFTLPFKELSLSTQLTVIGTTLGKISTERIESAIDAIKMRHKIVHEGWNPPNEVKTKIIEFMKTIAILLSGPKFKFPPRQGGNFVIPVEAWDKKK